MTNRQNPSDLVSPVQHTSGPRDVTVNGQLMRVWFTVDGPHRVEKIAQLGYCKGWKRIPFAGPAARSAVAVALAAEVEMEVADFSTAEGGLSHGCFTVSAATVLTSAAIAKATKDTQP